MHARLGAVCVTVGVHSRESLCKSTDCECTSSDSEAEGWGTDSSGNCVKRGDCAKQRLHGSNVCTCV